MVDKIVVKDTIFRFRIQKGCGEIGQFFIEAIQDAHARTHVLELVAKRMPKEVEITIKDRLIKRGVKADGAFIVPNRIAISAETLRILKKDARDLEAARDEMLLIFFHECAHWLTPDEDEANEIASEWAVSAAY